MPSEDIEKIIALTIVTLIYISVPFFVVIVILLVFIDIRFLSRSILEGSLSMLLQSIFVTIIIIIIIIILRFVIQWIKND